MELLGNDEVFTNKRLIIINVQGVTGVKTDYTSIPYSKIICFSVETSGIIDNDAELEIHLPSLGTIHFEFFGVTNIKVISKNIANCI